MGREDGGGGNEKGCKLIRSLSLHAPLPVLLLSNPGGQRCAAQRLDSQTQWGNNWYKQHLAAETLSVIQSDTISPVSFSQSAFSPIQKLFIHCSVSSSVPSFHHSLFWIFTKWQFSLSNFLPLLLRTLPILHFLLVFVRSRSINLMTMSLCCRTDRSVLCRLLYVEMGRVEKQINAHFKGTENLS